MSEKMRKVRRAGEGHPQEQAGMAFPKKSPKDTLKTIPPSLSLPVRTSLGVCSHRKVCLYNLAWL